MLFGQRLDLTGSVWNRYEIGTDKACDTGPGRFVTNRICYLVANESANEADPIRNCTVPASNRSHVNRVDPIRNRSEHI